MNTTTENTTTTANQTETTTATTTVAKVKRIFTKEEKEAMKAKKAHRAELTTKYEAEMRPQILKELSDSLSSEEKSNMFLDPNMMLAFQSKVNDLVTERVSERVNLELKGERKGKGGKKSSPQKSSRVLFAHFMKKFHVTMEDLNDPQKREAFQKAWNDAFGNPLVIVKTSSKKKSSESKQGNE